MNKKTKNDLIGAGRNEASPIKPLGRGLTSGQAAALLLRYGTNEVVSKKRISAIAKFLSYFKSPLILLLLVAAVLSGIFGELRSAVIIILMALLSVAMNFYQERKSGREVERLQDRLSLTAAVIRDGQQQEINVKFIVPGDTVVLSAGDIVPADGRVISCDDLFINESSLTGESFPIEKVPGSGQGKPTDQNIAFAGTNVVSGYGLVKITATGRSTSFGRIADKIQDPVEEDAFEKGIRGFGYLIIRLTIFIVMAVFLINVLKPVIHGLPLLKENLIESFLFAIAIAVGLTPELLPVIMSVNMAKGSIRMAKKGVLVKKLQAIPDFGSIDILCTDKTGTLTEDKITLVKYLDVTGAISESVLRYAYLNSVFQTGLKNPLDAAVLSFRNFHSPGYVKIDEIPYDFHRKRLSVVVAKQKERMLITKGQPDEIFKISSRYFAGEQAREITPQSLVKIRKVYDQYSREGYKMLAVATKAVKSTSQNVYSVSEESGMTLLGFVGFYDPPKRSAGETLKRLQGYNVEIKIITGDNELVTKKICNDLNLPVRGVMVGEELARMSDEALKVRVLKTTIFARFSPDQKNRVIASLRANQKVVGYLGDGINDAPSLKTADVGISVENAVDVAKETADIILLRKNLHELTEGIVEGRKTFGNTMKYLMMGLSSNFGNMFSLIAAAFFLPFLPMLPIQVLLNNTLYDISQVTIPSDTVDREYLKKPKHWDMNFIKKFMLIFGPVSSLFDVLTYYFLFSYFQLSAPLVQTGWFLESLATQTLVIYIIRTKRLWFRSRPSKYLVMSTLTVVVAGFAFALTPLGRYFKFVPLPMTVVATIFLLVALYLILVEIVKYWFYKENDL